MLEIPLALLQSGLLVSYPLHCLLLQIVVMADCVMSKLPVTVFLLLLPPQMLLLLLLEPLLLAALLLGSLCLCLLLSDKSVALLLFHVCASVTVVLTSVTWCANVGVVLKTRLWVIIAMRVWPVRLPVHFKDEIEGYVDQSTPVGNGLGEGERKLMGSWGMNQGNGSY
ncbi:hypothetical protein F4803DRAFT_504940 [Xylaria telfairii]|nr:hypothetical protein F4803DRAFT_504940 [Xylaria telfairii]